MCKSKILITVFMMGCLIANAQWSDNPAVNTRISTSGSSVYDYGTGVSSDGKVYITFLTPRSGNTATVLQILDTEGNRLFDDAGKLVSHERTMSFTVVGDLLFVDRDGNAIIAVTDYRSTTSNDLSYTLYKVSPSGGMLWSGSGIRLCDSYRVSHMRFAQLEDGSYVFAWVIDYRYIQLQRISEDGEFIWDEEEVRLYHSSIDHSFPHLVNAGNNQVILMYTRGSGSTVTARKLDFDGSPVWANDLIVYGGGFGTTPLQGVLRMIPDGMGGAFAGWFDMRLSSATTYVSWITADGKLGFASGTDGERVGYNDNLHSFAPQMYFDIDNSVLYVVYRESSLGQTWNQLTAQKIHIPSGELLWEIEGKEIVPLTHEYSISSYSIRGATNGNVAIFFMDSHNPFSTDICKVMLLDEEGKFLWKNEVIEIGNSSNIKSNFVSTPLINNRYWVGLWKIETTQGSGGLYAQRINLDGTLGHQDPVCDCPTNLTVRDITETSAEMSWKEGNAENISWDITYCEAVKLDWKNIENLNQKTYLLSDLTPNTVYLWTVKALCNDNIPSAWATQNSFTTQTSGISESGKSEMAVYFSGKMINIVNPENKYIEKVQLFDISGRKIGEYKVFGNNNILITTTINDGFAIVKIVGQNEVETFKVLNK